MSQVISFDDFIHGRFKPTGETIIVVSAEGKVLATIEPRHEPLPHTPEAFRDYDWGPPVPLPPGVEDFILESRDYGRLGKK